MKSPLAKGFRCAPSLLSAGCVQFERPPAEGNTALVTVQGDAPALREVLVRHPALFDGSPSGSAFRLRRERTAGSAP